jgi:NitT/TauT family transport system permease protein
MGWFKLAFLVPPPSKVIVTLFGLIQAPAFLNALGMTAYAAWFGAILAIGIVIPVGILIGKLWLPDELLLP